MNYFFISYFIGTQAAFFFVLLESGFFLQEVLAVVKMTLVSLFMVWLASSGRHILVGSKSSLQQPDESQYDSRPGKPSSTVYCGREVTFILKAGSNKTDTDVESDVRCSGEKMIFLIVK